MSCESFGLFPGLGPMFWEYKETSDTGGVWGAKLQVQGDRHRFEDVCGAEKQESKSIRWLQPEAQLTFLAP